MRHRLLAATALFALAPAGVALAAAPDSTTSSTVPSDDAATDSSAPTSPILGPSEDSSASATTVAMEPADVTVYDGDRVAVASVMALDSELAWTGYGEDDAPDEGNQYARVTLLITSERTDDDTFSINVDHFVLQDEHGLLTRGGNVRTAAQVDADQDVPDGTDLATGESIELTVTFQIPATVEPSAVFYLHDDRLYEILDLTPGAQTPGSAPTHNQSTGSDPTGSDPAVSAPGGSVPDSSDPAGTEQGGG